MLSTTTIITMTTKAAMKSYATITTAKVIITISTIPIDTAKAIILTILATTSISVIFRVD